jgi:hypothetical protein
MRALTSPHITYFSGDLNILCTPLLGTRASDATNGVQLAHARARLANEGVAVQWVNSHALARRVAPLRRRPGSAVRWRTRRSLCLDSPSPNEASPRTSKGDDGCEIPIEGSTFESQQKKRTNERKKEESHSSSLIQRLMMVANNNKKRKRNTTTLSENDIETRTNVICDFDIASLLPMPCVQPAFRGQRVIDSPGRVMLDDARSHGAAVGPGGGVATVTDVVVVSGTLAVAVVGDVIAPVVVGTGEVDAGVDDGIGAGEGAGVGCGVGSGVGGSVGAGVACVVGCGVGT